MKVWIVWADNDELYEFNCQDIWAVCASEDAAKQCIANASEQIRRDEERLDELRKIKHTRELTESEAKELGQIDRRRYCVPWSSNDKIPYFSIREFELIN